VESSEKRPSATPFQWGDRGKEIEAGEKPGRNVGGVDLAHLPNQGWASGVLSEKMTKREVLCGL
jgi:hypothetical protein